jgi:hypothetical protein
MTARKPRLAVATACDSPAVDPVEARWAAEAVGSLSRQLGADSLVAMVLEQAQRELTSLAASTAPADDGVIGPVRVRVAA